jgi:RecA-family ATPase
MSEPLSDFLNQATGLKVINGADWLITDPPPPDQILEDMLDAGDKMAVLASSKLRKSFFFQQMALSLAAGRDFLEWRVTKPRRVAYIQFEIREHHSHRRTRNLARAMRIRPDDLGDRLLIIPARGLGLVGADGLEQIRQAIAAFKPEVIMLDPLYKLAAGAENAAEDFKVLLNAFDQLAEQTGAAILYVHHDTKGSPGDKDIRDRGAGSTYRHSFAIQLTAVSVVRTKPPLPWRRGRRKRRSFWTGSHSVFAGMNTYSLFTKTRTPTKST